MDKSLFTEKTRPCFTGHVVDYLWVETLKMRHLSSRKSANNPLAGFLMGLGGLNGTAGPNGPRLLVG